MRVLKLLAVQSLLLGVSAFVAWTLLGNGGRWALSLSLDTLAACGIGVALVAVFLTFLALPIQSAFRNFSLSFKALVGFLCGPFGVWLGLLVLTSYPIDWEWYVARSWALHVVFAGVGLVFATACHTALRPNDSFKPTPLRGAA